MASLGLVFGSVSLLMALASMLLPVALLAALQVWLCRKSLRLGLILPVLSLLVALLVTASIAAFGRVGGGSYMSGGTLVTEEDGTVIEEKVYEDGIVTVYDGEGNVVDQYPDPDAPEQTNNTLAVWGIAAAVFLVANVPTLIFGGIWLHFKNRRDFQDDLKRMRIEDLE